MTQTHKTADQIPARDKDEKKVVEEVKEHMGLLKGEDRHLEHMTRK